MKVLLRRNVRKLGAIGDLVDVKRGYARNYLLPQGLAVQPTEANVKAVEAEKQRYLDELARQRADLEAKAAGLQGRELKLDARANEEGHLYGSVGPAQIAAALAADGIFVDAENIDLDPIRIIGVYDVPVAFTDDIKATMKVTVGDPAAIEALGEARAAAEAAEREARKAARKAEAEKAAEKTEEGAETAEAKAEGEKGEKKEKKEKKERKPKAEKAEKPEGEAPAEAPKKEKKERKPKAEKA